MKEETVVTVGGRSGRRSVHCIFTTIEYVLSKFCSLVDFCKILHVSSESLHIFGEEVCKFVFEQRVASTLPSHSDARSNVTGLIGGLRSDAWRLWTKIK